ncbi:UDP-glucuronic acid dehydrogenase [Pseudoalteromonas xiamenensis]|uniref:formyltransferase family protein n=1 Tax=Pseudoalteromonas xiamenensis TaxID=882626 RepID=UPI0027E58B17|nr:formyltransferase family protein [Pseudoalteromonas xiamenensis]WMN61182.1 UDP-glucuronic acid dehydrogenase [Pseudoalteromonas xiamenensis]
MIKITILCSSKEHPIYPVLAEWCLANKKNYQLSLINSVSEIEEKGDILFLVSCNEIITQKIRERYKYVLVIHASNLPVGRGWSPHIWQVVNGESEIVVSLLNAEDAVDTGDIWKQERFQLVGTELYDEINALLFKAEVNLINWACKNLFYANSYPQNMNVEPTYYRKRTPADSELDVNRTIVEQFNLLRVCDEERFPAFFVINGVKYKVKLEKMDPDNE